MHIHIMRIHRTSQTINEYKTFGFKNIFELGVTDNLYIYSDTIIYLPELISAILTLISAIASSIDTGLLSCASSDTLYINGKPS